MKQLILITLLIATSLCYTIDITKQCACTDVQDSTTCTTFGCKWDGSACGDPACSDNTTQTTCDATSTCAWTTAGACATFTACADYKVTDATMCPGKNSQCVASTTQNTDLTYTCQTGTTTTATYVTCSTITSAATCVGNESATSSCAWKAAATTPSCVALSMTSCSSASSFSQSVCEQQNCTWSSSDSTCKDDVCSGFTTSASCTVALSFDNTSGSLCSWSGSACSDAADATGLTSVTCQSYTVNTHLWNTSTSTCDECTGNAQIIIGLLAAWLLV